MAPPDDTPGQPRCVQHGTPTLLACARCETPLCPRCAVWTEVGQKCRNCAGRPGGRTRPRAVPVALAVAGVLAVVGATAYLGSDSFQASGTMSTGTTSTVPTVEMGREVTDQRLTYVVRSFNCGAKEVGTGDNVQAASGHYCFLEVSVRNSGSNPASFLGDEQFLVDSAERRYVADFGATLNHALPDRTQFLTAVQLNPGGEIEGVLVYDVAESAAVQHAEFHAGAGGPPGGRFGRTGDGRGVRVRLVRPA